MDNPVIFMDHQPVPVPQPFGRNMNFKTVGKGEAVPLDGIAAGQVEARTIYPGGDEGVPAAQGVQNIGRGAGFRADKRGGQRQQIGDGIIPVVVAPADGGELFP